MPTADRPVAEPDVRRALADEHARAWLHAYGIRTERYTASGGDHPAMDTLPAAMLAFADALALDPAPGDPDTVTLSRAEHDALLRAAGRVPVGVWVRLDQVGAGLHPSERHVRIRSGKGHAYVTVSERSIVSGCLSVGFAVGRKPGFQLVELPREADDGRWRHWVPDADITDDPERVGGEAQSGGTGL